MKLTARMKTALETVTAAGEGGTFLDAPMAAKLEEMGFIETNPDMLDDAGRIAVRIKRIDIDAGAVDVQPAASEKPKFAIVDIGELPAIARGTSGGRNSIYPFDHVDVNRGFFVPATPEKPEPWKSLASTVSSANARYASPAADGATRVNRKGREVPVMVKDREFVVRHLSDGALYGYPGVAGALVARIK